MLKYFVVHDGSTGGDHSLSPFPAPIPFSDPLLQSKQQIDVPQKNFVPCLVPHGVASAASNQFIRSAFDHHLLQLCRQT